MQINVGLVLTMVNLVRNYTFIYMYKEKKISKNKLKH